MEEEEKKQPQIGGEPESETPTDETQEQAVEQPEPEQPEQEEEQPEHEAPAEEPKPEPEPEPQPEPQPEEQKPQARTFTQEEVNAIVGKARQEGREHGRQEAIQELLGKYGVEGDGDFDDLVGKGQRFDVLSGDYDAANSKLTELQAENALLRSGVDKARFDDVKAVLAFQGKEVTPMNIEEALQTHPEWKGEGQNPSPAAPIVVKKMGGEPSHEAAPERSEHDQAMDLLGL